MSYDHLNHLMLIILMKRMRNIGITNLSPHKHLILISYNFEPCYLFEYKLCKL